MTVQKAAMTLTFSLFGVAALTIVRDVVTALLMAGWSMSPEGRLMGINPIAAFGFVLSTPVLFLLSILGTVIMERRKKVQDADAAEPQPEHPFDLGRHDAGATHTPFSRN